MIYANLGDQRTLKAKIVGRDPFTDLALLKVDANNLTVARFAPDKSVRPGDWAIAIGTPFGFEHSVSLGVVSAIGRSVEAINPHMELIQTDAAMNPGNSGGPLLNSKGEVIGINAAIRGNAQNIGFAVPVELVRAVSADLLAHGDVKRPFVGLLMHDITGRGRAFGIDHGVAIYRVVPGSPSDKAGLAPGDVILQLDGKPIENTAAVREFLKIQKPGNIVEITFFRKGNGEQRRKLVVGEFPYE
jgi:serine protease Do